MEDKQIIELYFERNERAIEETDLRYGKLCTQIARNLLQNSEDTEECVNDTYWNTWNSIPPTRPDHFKSFLCKITRNLALKRLDYNNASKRRPELCASLSELEEILPDEKIRPEITDEEIGKKISDFLRREKPDSRNVFLRKYWYFDSIQEIAQRYGYTESKIKTMLHRTRERLKKYLIKEGVEL